MSEDEEQGLKVKDRRRFDSSGNERSDDQQTTSQINQAGPGIIVDNERAKMAQSIEDETSEIEFSAFVMSLATQALMQLGVMQPPAGVQVPVDRESAKQTIEILSMLRVKTKGNLDSEETKLFEDILHSLRMSYVKAESE